MNGYQQGFRSVSSFGFGGQESASKPPQAICEPLAAIRLKPKKTIIHIALSALQFLVGLGCLGMVLYSIKFYFDYGSRNIENFEKLFSLQKTFLTYHFRTIIGLSLVIGAFLHLQKKKIGYITSILALILMFFELVRGIIQTTVENGGLMVLIDSFKSELNREIFLITLILLLPLLFLAAAIYHLKNPISEKFRLNKNDLLLMSIIGMVFILDLIFINR